MAAITFEEYQGLASRTAAKHDKEIVNYAMGLAGESGELIDLVKKFVFHGHSIPKDKVLKEAGDVLWYTSQLMRLFGISGIGTFNILKSHLEDLANGLIKHGGSELIDCVTTACLQLSQSVGEISQFVDGMESVDGFFSIENMNGNLSNILRNVYFLVRVAGLTIEEVAEANIEKLKKRYPDGFSTEKSINRLEE